MPEPQTTEKQVAEEVRIQFDFAADMDDDETITGLVSIVSENTGLVVASSNLAVTSPTAALQIAQAVFGGGTDMEKYKLTAKVQTSAGQLLETEGFMWVRNV